MSQIPYTDPRVAPQPGVADRSGHTQTAPLPPQAVHETISLNDPQDHAGRRADPVETFRQPDNRIKLHLFTAAMTLLNLLLLITLLVQHSETLADQVITVDGQRCLVVEQDAEDQLFCQR